MGESLYGGFRKLAKSNYTREILVSYGIPQEK
jgi:hypothetical protein